MGNRPAKSLEAPRLGASTATESVLITSESSASLSSRQDLSDFEPDQQSASAPAPSASASSPPRVNHSNPPHASINDQEDEEEDVGIYGNCSMTSTETMTCMPSMLTFYRKENPLVMTLGPQDNDDDDDDDEEEKKSEKTVFTPTRSPTTTTTNCATRVSKRRRSWPPKGSTTLNFFSKYSTSSSSSSSLVSLLSASENTPKYTSEELEMVDGHLPTEETDLTRLRDYCIVTTAALPWMTGTAVNPLLRAAYLSQYQRQRFLSETQQSTSTVTLVVPWLESAQDRQALYGKDWTDKTKDDQESHIRDWLANQANMPKEAQRVGGIRILFYPARYHSSLSSIFAMGDLCEFLTTQLPDLPSDAVLVLEEPEHMHYFRAQSWRRHFCHVIGVIHTNYKAYASTAMLAGSFITGPLIERISSWLVRAYCDQVIKLSPVLQSFGCPEKEVVCNVHGIRYDFIQEGARRARELQESDRKVGGRIYFLGKLLWAKGLDKLLELEAFYRSMTGDYFPIDIVGSGPEQQEIEHAFLSERGGFLGGSQSFCSAGALDELAKAPLEASSTSSGSWTSASLTSKRGLATTYYSTFVRPRAPVPARFLGRQDHAKLTHEYKVFVNPSVTEVLCTCTAEATAMGKFVIIPEHPSNAFFKQFPNCLLYKSKLEFVDFLQYAIAHDPEPLRDDLIHILTWEAATERFIEASAISRRDAKWRDRVGKTKSDEKIAKMHYELGKGAKGDVIRKVLGGGPVADQFQYDCRMLQAQLNASSEGNIRDGNIADASSNSSAQSNDEKNTAAEAQPDLVQLYQ